MTLLEISSATPSLPRHAHAKLPKLQAPQN